MRILHIPDIAVPGAAAASSPAPASVPVPAAEPQVTKEQMESLENIARSLLAKLEDVESRLAALEAAPKQAPAPVAAAPAPILSAIPASAPVSSPAPVSAPPPVSATPIPLDVDAVKKGLLTKMWKYMNDDESAKAV